MTSPTGHDLDQLLALWAQTHQLTDTDAEQIHQTIVPQDLALPATWWTDFNTKISQTITHATTMPAPAITTWT